MSTAHKTDAERLASIEVKLDQLIAANADKESRVRWLERRQYALTGILGVIIFVKDPLLHFFARL